MPAQPARPAESAEQLQLLRRQVQQLVHEWLDNGRFQPTCDAWLRSYDLEFTKALAEHGWIGITWPTELGGGGRSNVARLVVTEELLRAGAPVAAHWIADRQIGPAILRYGSTHLQRSYLPRIAAGEVTFCLGMSETESGSDLASVRTTATAVDGGWHVRGTKIWTSQAHRSTHAYLLARTDRGQHKHEGLTELIVDMAAPGVDVRPIIDLRGEHHFNEMTFQDVFVPTDHVLGQTGHGWQQVTEQLSFERGGMERVLSTYPLLAQVLATFRDRPTDLTAAARIGSALAQLASLRALAWEVAEAMDAGHAPVQQAAVLKDLGTSFEREVANLARELTWCEPDPSAAGLPGLLAGGILSAPGFSIRGGTTEVLRTVIARGAVNESPHGTGDLDAIADDVLADHGGDPPADRPSGPGPVWRTVCELGWPHVGVDEEAGGEGGSLSDLTALLAAVGRHAVPVPLAETAAAAHVLAAAGADLDPVDAVRTVALPGPTHKQASTCGRLDLPLLDRNGEHPTVTGTVTRVPWASHAQRIVGYAADTDDTPVAFTVVPDASGVRLALSTNLAAEPRDDLLLDAAPVRLLPAAPDLTHVQALTSLLRAAGLVGALRRAYLHTREHVQVREQFGRPLVRFQAVGHGLAALYSQLALAETAVRRAVEALGSTTKADDADADFDAATARVHTARVVAGAAATEAARLAHQLHGAMGVTREHPLHLTTRRLWAWRDEWHGQHPAAVALGTHFAGAPEDHLWDWLTARTEPVAEAP